MITANHEVDQLFRRWLNKTEGLLRQQLKQKKIGVTDELYKELMTQVTNAGQGYLQGDLSMLLRGRFVDMGVGRGHALGQSSRGGFDLAGGRSKRVPKKWYSRTWHGRLYDLYGAIGYEIMEQAINSIQNPIKQA